MAVIEERDGKQYIQIPVAKASVKGEPGFVEVCLDDLPNDVMVEVYLQGCKTLVNRGGMSKITGTKTDASRKRALEVAQENVQAMYDGKIRLSGGVRTKISGVVKTEAMRIARIAIKDALKAASEKVSHYSAKDISSLATELLQSPDGEEIMAQAQAAIKAREAKEKSLTIDISKIKPDAKLVAKANEKNASVKKTKAELAGVVAQHRQGAAQHANR